MVCLPTEQLHVRSYVASPLQGDKAMCSMTELREILKIPKSDKLRVIGEKNTMQFAIHLLEYENNFIWLGKKTRGRLAIRRYVNVMAFMLLSGACEKIDTGQDCVSQTTL